MAAGGKGATVPILSPSISGWERRQAGCGDLDPGTRFGGRQLGSMIKKTPGKKKKDIRKRKNLKRRKNEGEWMPLLRLAHQKPF